MVDFRSRLKFPTEAYLQARASRPSSFGGAKTLLDSATQGIMNGLQVSDTLDKIKQRNVRAEQLAELQNDPSYQELSAPEKYLLQEAPQSAVGLFTKKKQATTNPYNVIKSEMLKEFRKDPKKFKEQYGDEGVNIVGGKSSSNILEMLIDKGLLNEKE